MDPRITRPILFAEWPALMMLGTMVFTFLRLILYGTVNPDQTLGYFKLIQGMMRFSAMGWAASGMLGPLWLVLAGLRGHREKKDRRDHWLTIAGSEFFGMWMSL
ncbi:MAG: hypothetical protein OSB05_10565 [Akkermansiaceae bacterium]|nr:hypothetical protein [Akkermansiaceae bacterium]